MILGDVLHGVSASSLFSDLISGFNDFICASCFSSSSPSPLSLIITYQKSSETDSFPQQGIAVFSLHLNINPGSAAKNNILKNLTFPEITGCVDEPPPVF